MQQHLRSNRSDVTLVGWLGLGGCGLLVWAARVGVAGVFFEVEAF